MTYDEIREKLVPNKSLVRVARKTFGGKEDIFYAVYLGEREVGEILCAVLNKGYGRNTEFLATSSTAFDISFVELGVLVGFLNETVRFVNFDEKAQGEPCEQQHM